jgi:uncharacterized membrane protein
MMKRNYAILMIALIGILLAAYSIPLHYKTGAGSICDVSETINCDKVNKSPWSELFGIPVAILGLLSYLAVFVAVLMRKQIERLTAFTADDFWQYMLYFFAIMFFFQIYLTFAEIFWIHAYCIVCIASQVCTLFLVILGWQEMRYHKGKY